MELTEQNKKDFSYSVWDWFHVIDGLNMRDALEVIYFRVKGLTPEAVVDKLLADPDFLALVRAAAGGAPAYPSVVFSVGDSVCGLAARYGTTAEALEELNGLDAGEEPAVASVVRLR